MLSRIRICMLTRTLPLRAGFDRKSIFYGRELQDRIEVRCRGTLCAALWTQA